MADDAAQRTFDVATDAAGQRLDQFVAGALGSEGVSRSRVQLLLEQGDVLVNGEREKASYRLRGGERIAITGEARPAPLKATPEDIPLDIVYEDADLAVVNKPAGMMVHAGAGQTAGARSEGTLVNALLYRFKKLSSAGGELRPGIVHRLDKETSGLIVVAKNDLAHRRLAEQFAGREVHKQYIALVHGWPKSEMKTESGTISTPISRDAVRRTRMTTRRREGRSAITHYRVTRKIESPYGRFALLEVTIETGRTHQIRVHLSSIGLPVVGDTLYGAPTAFALVTNKGQPKRKAGKSAADQPTLKLDRNFLHAAAIELKQPSTGKALRAERGLPPELEDFVRKIERTDTNRTPG